MKPATIVKLGKWHATPVTPNPMERTLALSIRKERQRKAALRREADARRVASGKFNAIRGLEKLEVK